MAEIPFDDIINFGNFNQEAKKTEQSIDSLSTSVNGLDESIMSLQKTLEQRQVKALKDLQTQLSKDRDSH